MYKKKKKEVASSLHLSFSGTLAPFISHCTFDSLFFISMGCQIFLQNLSVPPHHSHCPELSPGPYLLASLSTPFIHSTHVLEQLSQHCFHLDPISEPRRFPSCPGRKPSLSHQLIIRLICSFLGTLQLHLLQRGARFHARNLWIKIGRAHV